MTSDSERARSISLLVRFTPAEKRILEDLCEATGLSMTAAIHLAIRDLARRQLGTAAPAKKARRGAR